MKSYTHKFTLNYKKQKTTVPIIFCRLTIQGIEVKTKTISFLLKTIIFGTDSTIVN